MTLIELMVVMGILSLVISLLLPAVQVAREAARRTRCASNMRQLALATQQYLGDYGAFPPVMTSPPPPGVYVGLYSIHTRLLPYIDATAIFNGINFRTGTVPPSSISSDSPPPSLAWTIEVNRTVSDSTLAVFLCPSDGLAALGPANNYRGNAGVGPEGHVFAEFKDSGNGLFPEVDRVSAASVPDGLSNTAAFSERLQGSGLRGALLPRRDFFPFRGRADNADLLVLACRASARTTNPAYVVGGHYWFWSGREHTLYNHAQAPNGIVPDCLVTNMIGAAGMATARSHHPGGANVAMGDGSVRFASDTIALPIWRAHGSRNGGEPVDGNP